MLSARYDPPPGFWTGTKTDQTIWLLRVWFDIAQVNMHLSWLLCDAEKFRRVKLTLRYVLNQRNLYCDFLCNLWGPHKFKVIRSFRQVTALTFRSCGLLTNNQSNKRRSIHRMTSINDPCDPRFIVRSGEHNDKEWSALCRSFLPLHSFSTTRTNSSSLRLGCALC